MSNPNPQPAPPLNLVIGMETAFKRGCSARVSLVTAERSR